MELDELIKELQRFRKADKGWVSIRNGYLMIDFDCGDADGLRFKEQTFD